MRPAAPCWLPGTCPPGGGPFPGSSLLSPGPHAGAAAGPFSHPGAILAEPEPRRPGPASRPGNLSSGRLLSKSLIPPRGVTGRGRAAEPVCVRCGHPGLVRISRTFEGARGRYRSGPGQSRPTGSAQQVSPEGGLSSVRWQPGARGPLCPPQASCFFPASSGQRRGGVGSPEAAPQPGDGGAGSWPVPHLWGRESARRFEHPHPALLGLRAPPADRSFISLRLRLWRETPSTP